MSLNLFVACNLVHTMELWLVISDLNEEMSIKTSHHVPGIFHSARNEVFLRSFYLRSRLPHFPSPPHFPVKQFSFLASQEVYHFCR